MTSTNSSKMEAQYSELSSSLMTTKRNQKSPRICQMNKRQSSPNFPTPESLSAEAVQISIPTTKSTQDLPSLNHKKFSQSELRNGKTIINISSKSNSDFVDYCEESNKEKENFLNFSALSKEKENSQNCRRYSNLEKGYKNNFYAQISPLNFNKDDIEKESDFRIEDGADTEDKSYHDDDISSFFKYYRQVFSVMVTSTMMLLSGMVIGWSTVIPKIQEDETHNITLTDTQVKWIVSCAWLAEIPANLIAGSIMECLGPRKVMILLQIPAATSWILLAYMPSVPVFYACRVCLGLVQGFADTLVQPLAAELSEPGIRGTLSVLPAINAAFGVLVVYLLANFCNWQTATALCAIPAILTFLLSPLVPESSYWLMRHDKREEARSSLEQLMGKSNGSNRVDKLFSEIETSVRNQPVTSLMEQIRLLKMAQYWKPLLLLTIMFIARETTGQSIVFSYTVYLFQESGVTLDAFTCTVMVGVVRLVFTVFGAFMMDVSGRRPLLIGALSVCSIGLLISGVTLVADIGYNWVPLCGVLLFAAGYSAGVNPVPWALQGELLPSPIRFLGSSLTTVCYSLNVFAVTNIFPELLRAIGMGYSFIAFSICAILTTIMAYAFIPETSGRSLLELEKAYVKNFDNEECSEDFVENEESDVEDSGS